MGWGVLDAPGQGNTVMLLKHQEHVCEHVIKTSKMKVSLSMNIKKRKWTLRDPPTEGGSVVQQDLSGRPAM